VFFLSSCFGRHCRFYFIFSFSLYRLQHGPPHPDRDPVRLSSILWPRPQNLKDYSSSDVVAEFLDKWFSIPKICQSFDIDGWHARDIIAPLFCNDSTDLHKGYEGIRPILCGEIWRRCFASLAVTATPIRNEAAKLFTSTYDNFIQTAGIRDGASHCAKILACFYDNLETSL
jgi:hypothetical protein